MLATSYHQGDVGTSVSFYKTTQPNIPYLPPRDPEISHIKKLLKMATKIKFGTRYGRCNKEGRAWREAEEGQLSSATDGTAWC